MSSDGQQVSSARRVARNQALFRAVNEQIESTNERFGITSERAEFLCECADLECNERVTLNLGQYEELRRVPTHFVVKAGHVYPDFEQVVGEMEGNQVVEKEGEAAAEVRKLDQRARPTGLQL
jgi:hypothetical protein